MFNIISGNISFLIVSQYAFTADYIKVQPTEQTVHVYLSFVFIINFILILTNCNMVCLRSIYKYNKNFLNTLFYIFLNIKLNTASNICFFKYIEFKTCSFKDMAADTLCTLHYGVVVWICCVGHLRPGVVEWGAVSADEWVWHWGSDASWAETAASRW